MVDQPFKAFLRRLARRTYDFARYERLPVMNRPDQVEGIEHAIVRTTAKLSVDDPQNGGPARIILGAGAYIGERVELAALKGGSIRIGNDTSLQNDCLVGGDVRIGAHCLFGKYVFASSTNHRFADIPAWLIRDQDHLAIAHPEALKSPVSRAIVIEDDCWIGQGVVISPGVQIGRGAVIGANCVVSRDIPPYEIHGGAPNRCIGTRLTFVPPSSLSAERDEHLPYFYRGFRLSQDALSASRVQGVVRAHGPSWLVLAKGKRLTLRGRCNGTMALSIRIHGISCGSHTTEGNFDLSVDVPIDDSAKDFPRALQPYMLVEIAPAPFAEYGIATAVSEASPT